MPNIGSHGDDLSAARTHLRPGGRRQTRCRAEAADENRTRVISLEG